MSGRSHKSRFHEDIDRGVDLDDRTSAEIFREGHDVLEDDYETDELSRKSQSSRLFSRLKETPEVAYNYSLDMYNRSQRKKKRHVIPEEEHMMQDMEEGPEAHVLRTDSEESLAAWKEGKNITPKPQPSRKASPLFNCILHTVIILFFLSMLYGAYKATIATTPKQKGTLVSNGTSLWAPTTLIISLDGFRADFLDRGLSPTLNQFIKEGVSPLYMLPPFPSVTFVSHYTMSTGLHPESHGIVGNSFWDPQLREEFFYTKPEHSMQPKWWGGEPFWVSAEKQGLKTAVHMWPGSEAHIGRVELDYVDPYNGSEILHRKTNRVLEWLDLPGPSDEESISESPRPQLLVAYVPNVDVSGHKYGPNSTETRQAITDADNMLTEMFDGIAERNLTDIINIIVVSDHGMATTSVDRLIQIDDLIDLSKIEHIDGWPLYGLRPKNDEDIEPLYHELKAKSKTNPYFEVYLRDLDMPDEYHFSKNQRIAPLWIIPQTGWAIVTRSDFDVAKAKAEGLVYNPKGLHGYDYRHPLMRAIFVARGPAFPHLPHSRIDPFQNINLYNIICDSLGIEPALNNGTIRLPFKTTGLHSDHDAPKLEIPDDLPAEGDPANNQKPPPSPPPTFDDKPKDTPEENNGELDKGRKGGLSSVWDWIRDSFGTVKGKIKEIFDKVGGKSN